MGTFVISDVFAKLLVLPFYFSLELTLSTLEEFIVDFELTVCVVYDRKLALSKLARQNDSIPATIASCVKHS